MAITVLETAVHCAIDEAVSCGGVTAATSSVTVAETKPITIHNLCARRAATSRTPKINDKFAHKLRTIDDGTFHQLRRKTWGIKRWAISTSRRSSMTSGPTRTC